LDVDGRAGGRRGIERLGVLPGDRLAGSAGVAEHQSQPGLAVALAAQLALADGVDARHAPPVVELGQGDTDVLRTVPVR